jgi:hypothetical protein
MSDIEFFDDVEEIGRPEPRMGPAPRLGSLAQSARARPLRRARMVLFAIGGLMAAVAVLPLLFANSIAAAAADALQKSGNSGGRLALDAQTLRASLLLVFGLYFLLGGAFIASGWAMKKFPAAAAMLGLTMYLGETVIEIVFSIKNGGAFSSVVFHWWNLVRIAVIAVLAVAVESAIIYQRKRAALATIAIE